MDGFSLKRLAAALVVAGMAFGGLQAEEAAKAQVMVVNCYPGEIDLQLGDDPVFSVSLLAAANPTRLQSVPADIDFPLYFKASASQTWRYYQNPDKPDAGVSFAAGRLTVIRIDHAGGVELIDLADLGDDGLVGEAGSQALPPQVFFLNAGLAELPGMQLVDPSLNPVAEVAAIPGQAFTGLVSIATGQLAGLLPREGQGAAAALAATADGVLRLMAFQPGERYMVVASGESTPELKIWQVGTR